MVNGFKYNHSTNKLLSFIQYSRTSIIQTTFSGAIFLMNMDGGNPIDNGILPTYQMVQDCVDCLWMIRDRCPEPPEPAECFNQQGVSVINSMDTI